MLKVTENLVIMYFPDVKLYFIVEPNILYNENVQGREIFDRGNISRISLEELFLTEYIDYVRI